MKVRRTERFKKDYQKLPADIQRCVDEKLSFLLHNVRYPSLRVQSCLALKDFGN